jgi:hypothetical protein
MIVSGNKSAEQARDYYAKEFADFRRKEPTPYMDGLRFTPSAGNAADPDERVLSDEQLKQAVEEGEAKAGSRPPLPSRQGRSTTSSCA